MEIEPVSQSKKKTGKVAVGSCVGPSQVNHIKTLGWLLSFLPLGMRSVARSGTTPAKALSVEGKMNASQHTHTYTRNSWTQNGNQIRYQWAHNKTRFAVCGSQALNHSKPKHGIRTCSLRNFPGSPCLPSEIFVVMALWKVRLVNRIGRMKPRTCTTTPVESRTARSPNSLLRLSLGRGLPQSHIMSHHVTSNAHSNCVIWVCLKIVYP